MNSKSTLRLLRVLSGKTQVQVGNATGITPARLSLLENALADPRRDEMERIAKALGLRPEEIWIDSNQHAKGGD